VAGSAYWLAPSFDLEKAGSACPLFAAVRRVGPELFDFRYTLVKPVCPLRRAHFSFNR
jgi:hypothetical protein